MKPGALLVGLPLLGLLLLPLIALGTSADDLWRAAQDPRLLTAAWLSAWTSAIALAIVLACGTPLAWWLAGRRGRAARWIGACVELPIVLPPAVLGLALLLTFGRQGLLPLGLSFTSGAVILAQVVVAAPFYVRSATAGFAALDPDLLLVARTLGVRARGAALRVAIPAALPALAAGLALGWARAIGEFGATLLFAGSLPGSTQTLPIAIYSAMEIDLPLARAMAMLLAFAALGVLLVTRPLRA